MSEIPSEIASSAAQAGFRAREVAKERDARRAGGADAALGRAKSVDEAGSTVETENEDTAVFTESEGAGGQGRAHEEGESEDAAQEEQSLDDDVTVDDEGRPHLDLEA